MLFLAIQKNISIGMGGVMERWDLAFQGMHFVPISMVSCGQMLGMASLPDI